MKALQPKFPSPVLSEESRQFKSQPGWERHQRLAPNVQGEMAEWKQLTPRRKQARDVGTLLLRVPLPPAPHLVHGRGAEELLKSQASHQVSADFCILCSHFPLKTQKRSRRVVSGVDAP
eukprot:s508_g22.t1